MSKHTPGPWLQNKYGSVVDRAGDGVQFRGVSTLCSGSDERIEEAEANTRLIAAAPDLLEALEDCVQAMQMFRVNGQILVNAKAAIAKAKGEQA